jgi:hypothetical protein
MTMMALKRFFSLSARSMRRYNASSTRFLIVSSPDRPDMKNWFCKRSSKRILQKNLVVYLHCLITRCLALSEKVFRASPSDCEGFLSLPRGSSRIGYSSGARGLEDPHLVSVCAAPAEGLTLDSWLARDPSSGCIATTRSSLPGRK